MVHLDICLGSPHSKSWVRGFLKEDTLPAFMFPLETATELLCTDWLVQNSRTVLRSQPSWTFQVPHLLAASNNSSWEFRVPANECGRDRYPNRADSTEWWYLVVTVVTGGSLFLPVFFCSTSTTPVAIEKLTSCLWPWLLAGLKCLLEPLSLDFLHAHCVITTLWCSCMSSRALDSPFKWPHCS